MSAKINVNPFSVTVATMIALTTTVITAAISNNIAYDEWAEGYKRNVSDKMEIIRSNMEIQRLDNDLRYKDSRIEELTAQIRNLSNNNAVTTTERVLTDEEQNALSRLNRWLVDIRNLAIDPLSEELDDQTNTLRILYCRHANPQYFASKNKLAIQVSHKNDSWHTSWRDLDLDSVLRQPNDWLTRDDNINKIKFPFCGGIEIDVSDPIAVITMHNMLNNLRREASEDAIQNQITSLTK